MTSARKLPIVKMGRHDFIADFRNGEFRLVANEKHTIPMFQFLSEHGDIDFIFDKRTARVADKSTPQADYVRVTLSPIATDPEYFRQRDTETEESRTLRATGRSIYNLPAGIHSWTSLTSPGALPIVDISGTDFFLDLPAKTLRQVDNTHNQIRWDALNRDGDHLCVFYDANNKNVFNGRWEDAIAHGSNVKVVTLPPLDKLIDHGLARYEVWCKTQRDSRITKSQNNEEPLRRRNRGKGI